jgi:outer membrane protein assembly factor BamD (BamD/ComL family)
MKKALLTLSFFIFTFAFSTAIKAQDSSDSKTNAEIIQDKIFEEDAQHNLDVAKQYFKLKKAYKGVIMRFEETFAAYPQFSKMDEFLYIAAMSSYYLSDNKGKQKIDFKDDEEKEKFAPEKLKENAVAYFGILKDQYPNSEYKDDAEKMLKKLKDGK